MTTFDPGPPPSVPEDAEFATFVYDESVRSLTQQAGVLDNLRTRTGLLLTAANLVTALLAAPAVSTGLTPGVWLALSAFVVSVGLALLVLQPYGKWSFSLDTIALQQKMAAQPAITMSQMRLHLMRLNETSVAENDQRLERLFIEFRLSSLALVIEVLCWVLVLAKASLLGVSL